jgi:transcription antitermination factor NusG
MNLKAWGITTFSPKIKEMEYAPYSNKGTYVVRPLFPRYIFARFSADKIQKVQYTRGVYRVVCFGDDLTPIADEVIAEIKSRIGTGGYVNIVEELVPGNKVIIRSGPMANFRGIFIGRVGAEDRVRILLETISYQAHLEIERGALQKSSQ